MVYPSYMIANNMSDEDICAFFEGFYFDDKNPIHAESQQIDKAQAVALLAKYFRKLEEIYIDLLVQYDDKKEIDNERYSAKKQELLDISKEYFASISPENINERLIAFLKIFMKPKDTRKSDLSCVEHHLLIVQQKAQNNWKNLQTMFYGMPIMLEYVANIVKAEIEQLNEIVDIKSVMDKRAEIDYERLKENLFRGYFTYDMPSPYFKEKYQQFVELLSAIKSDPDVAHTVTSAFLRKNDSVNDADFDLTNDYFLHYKYGKSMQLSAKLAELQKVCSDKTFSGGVGAQSKLFADEALAEKIVDMYMDFDVGTPHIGNLCYGYDRNERYKYDVPRLREVAKKHNGDELSRFVSATISDCGSKFSIESRGNLIEQKLQELYEKSKEKHKVVFADLANYGEGKQPEK